MRKLLAELTQLGRDDITAISLLRVIAEVVLMIVLGAIEYFGRADMGHDRSVKRLLAIQFANDRFRRLLLRLGVIEDYRAILLAGVVPLAIERSGVVYDEENFEHVAKRNHGGVERHLYYFNMAGVAAADLAIRRVEHAPAHVTRNDRRDALHLLVDRFETPKAATAERRDFLIGHDSNIADSRIMTREPADDLIVHCRRSLAKYKVPRRIEFSETELPKSGSGKILKRILQERFWANRERAVS